MIPADPFDLACIGRPVTNSELAALTRGVVSARLPRPAKGEQYLGGPVPMDWLERAAKLPGKAFHLGIALWFEAGRSKGKKPAVKLTDTLARRFGLGTRTTRSRALTTLKNAGLVSVVTNSGCAPVVTILVVECEDSAT